MEVLIDALFGDARAATMLGDFVRLIHIGAIALGLGTVVMADFTTLRRIGRPVTAEFCSTVQSAHAIILPALVFAWLTGIILLGLRTGFTMSEITPKLWTKLAVVGSLTVTVFAIRHSVLPAIERNIGRTLMEASLGEKLTMAVCAAFSMAGWSSALLLGGHAATNVAPVWVVILAVFVIHAVLLVLALRSTFLLHDRVQQAVDLVERKSREFRIT